MKFHRKVAQGFSFCATVFAILFTISTCALAQTPTAGAPAKPKPSPSPSPKPSLEKNLLRNILHDQRAIWLSPFSIHHDDVKWLVPLGISTAVLIGTDRRTSAELLEGGSHQTRLNVSHDISKAASYPSVIGAVAAFYLVGRAKNDQRARETGLLAAEALIDGNLVAMGLKLATQRPRPNSDNGRGRFRADGSSFPSGHAINAWALASVVAQEYKDRPLVKWGMYGLATAVSVSRYTGRSHFLSDVLVGSAIGYGIGRYVYHEHHDKSLDGDQDNTITTSLRRSKFFPMIAPQYSRVARAYGLTLAWSF